MKNKLTASFTFGLALMLVLSGCNPTDPSNTTDTLPPIIENSLLTGEIPSNKVFKIGDQMYDYTFTDIDDNKHVISNILENKDLFVLNLFASWCGPCAQEMPALQEAYVEYQNDVEVIALTVEPADTPVTIKTKFKDKYGLTFPLCLDTDSLSPHLFGSNYAVPQTFFIDRYGTIVESHQGSIIAKKGWTSLFDKYIGSSYVPPVFNDTSNPGDDPTLPPTTSAPTIDVEMPDSKLIEDAINHDSYNFGYSKETGSDAEHSWPWLISPSGDSIYPGNSGVDNSFAIIHSDFEITDIYKNVLTFDYLASCEIGYDYCYVLIDGVIVKEISDFTDDWKTCYAYVPSELGSHRLTLIYTKDDGYSEGDDKVYIKNMRFINVDDIGENIYVKRYAPSGLDGNTGHYTKYKTLVFNENDGFYHIDRKDGPLILAELNRYTPFTNETSVYGFVVENKATVNGVDYGNLLTEYAQYGNNSENGLCPVTEELKVALEAVINLNGDNPSKDQWQEVCYYYDAYGPNAEEMPSPTYGVAYFDAIHAEEGEEVEVNFDRVIIPRGKYVDFTPKKSGVYRVVTIGDEATFGSILDENRNVIEESTPYNFIQTALPDRDDDLIMHAYMEANKTYYIRSSFNFPDQLGSYKVKITYVGEEYDMLTLCANSTAFTTNGEEFDLEGEMQIISPSINVTLKDGYYYHDLGNGKVGSAIYADLLNYSSMFYLQGKPASLKTIIENGGGVFEIYTEEGNFVSSKDLTEVFNTYIAKAEASISDDNPYGLIQVDETLADALQTLMDGYTFYNVKNSWLKLCYYYKHYGPTA